MVSGHVVELVVVTLDDQAGVAVVDVSLVSPGTVREVLQGNVGRVLGMYKVTQRSEVISSDRGQRSQVHTEVSGHKFTQRSEVMILARSLVE